MTSFVFRSRVLRVATLVAFLVMVIPAAGYSAEPQATDPQTYWVDAENGDDSYAGTEAEPFETISHALSVATPVDTIMVEPGTYDVANGESFPLYVGGETLMSTSGAEVTILHGDDAHQVIGGNTFSAGDMIKGFTIEHGALGPGAGMQLQLSSIATTGWPRIEGNIFKDNVSASFAGGALSLVTFSSITVTPLVVNNTFVDNSASQGGAVNILGSIDVIFEDNTFTGNASNNNGGAVYTAAGSAELTFIDNVFEENTAQNAGGALYLDNDGSTTLDSNMFVANSAKTGGGAIRASGVQALTLEGNVFQSNATMSPGGALYASIVDSAIAIVGNAFVNNSATASGGAIYMSNTGTTEVINQNQFIENAAGTDGGALWLYGANASMEANDAGGNDANGGSGGFAYLDHTLLEASNNVIGGHSATVEGAAWFLTYASLVETNDTVVQCTGTDSAAYQGESAQLEIYNSIYWNPTVTADVENAYHIGYSCLYDASPGDHGNTIGSGVIYDDPQFIDLSAHDARLGLGSPCIDTANTALGPAGDFFGTLRPQDGDGDSVAVSDMGYFEKPPLDVAELQGDDRYATAVAIAAAAFDASEYAVIASGENYPDALSASGLAGAYECPLVLTRSTSLPSVTADFLVDLGVEHVFIVGGTAAIGQDVYDLLAADYDVVRIAGDTRYDTAAEVAQEIADHQGSEFMGFAFVARGDSFPDALSLSPLAFSNAVPILLTRPTSLPLETATALEILDIQMGVVAGGLSAVDAATKSAIDAIIVDNEGTATERWFGDSRYATAVAIATNAVDAHMATWDNVGIATGQNYPDALAGGARIGMGGGVVLLTGTNLLPTATSGALTSNAARILYVDVFGGPSAVSVSVRAAIEDALGW